MSLQTVDYIQPPFLVAGDSVALIATARKIELDQLQPAIDQLESWGLTVVLGKHLLAAHHQFAGTDEERVSDLHEALNNVHIKAVFCFRGGYGSVRLLDKLEVSSITSNLKWLVGYSDVTALHNVWHNVGIMSIHGTMPVNFSTNTKEALDSLKKTLFGAPNIYSVAPHALNRKGTANGVLVGGNLSMLLSLAGTIHDIDTTDKILVLEDLDEYLYHIDRMMWNLKLAGKLSSLAGLIVGGFTDMKDNTVPFGKTAYEILAEAVADYTYPVCFDFPFGHVHDNRALTMGKVAKLEITQDKVTFFQ
jgi:muramoyltetrapeptide carboxypeptidase